LSSPLLVGVARRNAEIFNRGRVTPTAIETLHMDPRDYVLPDVPLVLFFFSPFKGAVLDRANQHHRVLRAKSPPALHAARNRSKNFMPRDFSPAKFRLNATELDLSTTAASSSPHLTEE
jgi:hypothetical protein